MLFESRSLPHCYGDSNNNCNFSLRNCWWTLFGTYHKFNTASDETLLTSSSYNQEFANFRRTIKTMQLLYTSVLGEFAGIMQMCSMATQIVYRG